MQTWALKDGKEFVLQASGGGGFIKDPEYFADQQVREWPELETLKGSWSHTVKSFMHLMLQGLEAIRSPGRFCTEGFREPERKLWELGR